MTEEVNVFFTTVSWLVGWFVCRKAQEALNKFQLNQDSVEICAPLSAIFKLPAVNCIHYCYKVVDC